MVRCPTESDLARYLDGALDAAERERLAEHESHCEDCSAWLAEARSGESLLGLLRSAPVQERAQENRESPPPGLSRYLILRRLGAGGMGIVYEAEQLSLGRSVALKVLAPGLVSERALARFEREARILSRLEHEGIARVVEADVYEDAAGARPFFAMELVEGEPLDQHVRARDLTVEERQRLFLSLCSPVRHAHARGVVHRDLKPANVLVRADGSPVVLDFGIARALDASLGERALATQPGAVLGTLATMAPEQLAGDPDAVDARADLYALGAILYLLLSGRYPLELEGLSLPEAVRAVAEREPTPLGVLDPRLRGDLETIAGKCFEKDPERRYESVAELAEDVERHLALLPIRARPPSTLYVAGRLARRHRAALIGGTAAVLALVVGLAVAVDQARRARTAEGERAQEAAAARVAEAEARAAEATAERAAARAETVSDFLQEVMLLSSPEQRFGAEPTIRDALAVARERVERGSLEDPLVEADLQLAIGRSLAALGEYDEAEAELARAEELFAAAGDSEREGVARTLAARADVALRRHDYASADALGSRAREVAREAAVDDPLLHGTIANALGLATLGLGREDEAQALLETAIELFTTASEKGAADVAISEVNLALCLRHRGESERAVEMLHAALPALREHLGEDHPAVASALSQLGEVHLFAQRFAEAEEFAAAAVLARERQLGDSHPTLAIPLRLRGLARHRLGRREEAAADLTRALLLVSSEPSSPPAQLDQILLPLYVIRLELGDLEGAIEACESLLEVRREAHGDSAPLVYDARVRLTKQLVRARRGDAAEQAFGDTLPALTALYGSDSANVAHVRAIWGTVLVVQGRVAEAQAAFEEARAVLVALEGEGSPTVSMIDEHLSRVREAVGSGGDER